MAAPELNVRANAALDDLYRRHVGDVYRYTYAVLGNHADAEDVTQTTFVNALRALERGNQPRDPSSWLLAISHNIVRQRWRQAAVRPTEVELAIDVPDESAEPDVELDELVRALQRIPPAQREALVMRELEGRSYNEISDLLGLTTSALETLLFRARRSLAEELQNIVTCQSAELAMSKQLDGRLSRKERRRLDEHLAECDACAKLAETQRRQRRAFKGLAVLPIPVGLAVFKGVPTASAATLPTIGIGATGSGTGVGATGVGAGGAGAGATAAAGGTVAGGSILGSAVAKVAAVVIAGTVATGVGYEGVKAVTSDAKPTPARSSDERAATPSSRAATPATVPATTLSGRRDVGTSFVPSGGSSGSSSSAGSSIAANPTKQPLDDSPVVPSGSGTDDAGNAAAPPDTTPRKNPKSNPPATTPPETTPPVATPTPPETPAGPPASTPPESPGASGSTSPATSTGTPPTGSGGPDGQSACPAGGSGPGNGSGCGLARGHERETTAPAAPSTPAPDTTPTPQVPTEPGAGPPESAGPSVGESMSDTHAGKSDS
jgi:RNA polymerase sigma factor (sigma-70 family)